jgi:hypothetical protein
LIKGAGISLISGTVILTVINFLINRFISDFFVVGDLASLVGVSGLDQCISIVISAMIARAMISSTSMSFKRHKKTIAEGGEDDGRRTTTTTAKRILKMIYLITATPGSGKTLWAVKNICSCQ